MAYCSLALELTDWDVLIVGAGNRVAGRRARLLLAEGARITVIAPEIGTEIDRLATEGQVTVIKRGFEADDLKSRRLVLAATDDHDLNRRIATLCHGRGVLVNCASKGTLGSVMFPARYRSRGVEVSVHDQGGSVRRVLHVRDRVAKVLESSGELAQPVRREGGFVYLIGAGPGAPDLLTLRALRAIQNADVVITDKILGPDFLERIDVDCRDKQVVRLGGGTDSPARQQSINEALVRDAQRGLIIARVKNGDPLVFGRGAEEADYLNEHGIGWEFIPGLSSSISLLTNAGMPITNRGSGRSFAVVSARLAGGAFNERFPHADSLVFLMGIKVMGTIRERLLAEGWDAATPAAVIERGGLPYERRLRAPLSAIIEKAAELGVTSPSIFVIGVAAERRYTSQSRPTLILTGSDPAPYRALGDLLHWPIVGGEAELLQGTPSDHAGVIVTSIDEWQAWVAAQGLPTVPVYSDDQDVLDQAAAAGCETISVVRQR